MTYRIILAVVHTKQIMTKKKRVHETITQCDELRKKLEKLSEFMSISYPERAKVVQNLWQDFNRLKYI